MLFGLITFEIVAHHLLLVTLPISQMLSHQVGASYVHWIQLGVVSHSTFVDPSTYLQYMLLAPEIRVNHVLVHQQLRRHGVPFMSVLQQSQSSEVDGPAT